MIRQRKPGAHENTAVLERTARQRVQTPPPADSGPKAQDEPVNEKKPKIKAVRATPPRSPRRRRRNRFFLIGVAAAVLALLVAAMLLATRLGGLDRDARLEQAREAYARADYDTALRYARKADDGRDDEDCLLLMADCYLAQGNLDKALELLRRLDVSDAAVSRRIEEIDRQRRAAEEASKISVLGMRFDADTTDLVLDDMELRDGELQEILQLYALDNLSLMNNELEDISALTKLGGLDTLNLSGNHIRDLSPLAELTELRTLYLDGNPVEDFSPLYGLTRLSMLSIRGVSVTKEQLSELSAALPGCAILSDAAKEEAADITIGGVSFKSDVSELDLSGLGIRDISALGDCRNLRYLKLGGNEISDLTALMNLPGLEVLDLSGNVLSDLRPLMGIHSLRTLNVADNQLLDTTAIGAMTSLTNLDLSGNALTDYSGLKNLKNLQTLKLRRTGIRDEDLGCLAGLGLLTRLELDENGDLSDPAVSWLNDMLPSCTISCPDLVYLARIGSQDYRSNQTELEIHGENMTDLGEIDRMDRLETALLSGNKLTNIYMLQYSASRDSLRVLDLSSNQLEDISALASLTAIEELNLSDNRINTVQPLLRLTTLKTLRVDGNPLTPEQLEALREALPDTEIRF